jgi:hypothetical protein
MMRTLCVLGALLGGCAGTGTVTASSDDGAIVPRPGPTTVIEPAPGVHKPPFRFNAPDEAMLDDIQRGCFLFFWHEVSPKTGMVVDRTSGPLVSVAGVGFQLSALPIGVERKWVSKDDARERASLILSSLQNNRANRRHGLFYHYLDPDTAGPHTGSHEHVISTIDSALLIAGIITAGEYFGGSVKQAADALVRECDWQSFVLRKSQRAYEEGFISLGFRPSDPASPDGAGELLPYVWADAGDEQRLVTFLGVGAVKKAGRVEPEVYYRLRRQLGSYRDTGPLVWFPWSGALFTNVFAHCWIDFRSYGTDNPAGFGIEHRAPVDWWENSRRAVRLHQLKARDNPRGFAGWGKNAWGLTASDAPSGYAVPGVFPVAIPMEGAAPNVDFAVHTVQDDLGDGTLAPYAAGSAIMFDQEASLAALRHYQGLRGPDGKALVWREPNPAAREYGFRDAFNQGKGWVATDYVAIDQGPLILSIENARTGLIWRLFSGSEVAKGAAERLRLRAGKGAD